MLKFEEILKAWIIKYNPTEKQKELALKRLDICNECPSRKEKTFNSTTLIVYCGECGCPLEAKSHSPKRNGACPLGKWDALDKNFK
jgi:hypothetical protein